MKIHLFHFNKDKAPARAKQLERLGYDVNAELPNDAQFYKRLKINPPDLIVIDLSRLPSSGRDIGIQLRTSKATRYVPIVFVDGKAEKIERVKQNLPDAIYTSWDEIENSIKHALANPITDPVVPASNLAGYSGTPLPKKLTIKQGMVVGLIHVPESFEQTLGELPPDVKLLPHPSEQTELLLWFLRSSKELEASIKSMVELAEYARIWMIWPKKTSVWACDLTQQIVRETGLNAGLVDYKVCAVDESWSGLLFTKKKK